MKYLFKITPEHVRSYNRFTHGYELIQTVASNEEAYDVVANLEDDDFFDQEDGTVNNCNGNEVYDPKYPDMFDFRDYSYQVIEFTNLDRDSDEHIIRAFLGDLLFDVRVPNSETLTIEAIEELKSGEDKDYMDLKNPCLILSSYLSYTLY